MGLQGSGKGRGRQWTFVLPVALLCSLCLLVPPTGRGADSPAPSFHYYPYTLAEGARSGTSYTELQQHIQHPVNAMFYDAGETRYTLRVLATTTGWQYTEAKEGEWFWQFDRPSFRPVRAGIMSAPDENHSFSGPRYHVRLLQLVQEALGDAEDPRYRWVTGGSGRREHTTRCGNFFVHVPVPLDWNDSGNPGGYVEAKIELARVFPRAALHRFGEGNTRSVRFCDGSRARDNGYQLWIRV